MTRVLSAVLATLLLTGCLGSVDPVVQRKYGFIIMETRDSSAVYSTSPLGIFYRSQPLALPDTQARDFCFTGFVDSTATGFNPNLDHLDAGDFISMRLSGVETELVWKDSTQVSAEVYRPNAVVAFTPGDTVFFDAPGGPDFPSFVARLKTAEPFTMQPVGLPAQGASLTLSWSAPSGPGSKMIVSLRWKSDLDQNVINQLYCDLTDDGSFVIPSQQVIGWRLATERQVVATRERTTTPVITGVTLRAISNFTQDIPVAQ